MSAVWGKVFDTPGDNGNIQRLCPRAWEEFSKSDYYNSYRRQWWPRASHGRFHLRDQLQTQKHFIFRSKLTMSRNKKIPELKLPRPKFYDALSPRYKSVVSIQALSLLMREGVTDANIEKKLSKDMQDYSYGLLHLQQRDLLAQILLELRKLNAPKATHTNRSQVLDLSTVSGVAGNSGGSLVTGRAGYKAEPNNTTRPKKRGKK